MQSLEEKASEWSGVDPKDTVAIDETNLFEKLGLQTFINLSTNFYNSATTAKMRIVRDVLSDRPFVQRGELLSIISKELSLLVCYLHYTSSIYLLLSFVRVEISLVFGIEIRVYDDEEEWFRSIFSNSSKEDAIRNQYEFFVQRMGGPNLYSQRKGHTALISRHRTFPVTHKAAEKMVTPYATSTGQCYRY